MLRFPNRPVGSQAWGVGVPSALVGSVVVVFNQGQFCTLGDTGPCLGASVVVTTGALLASVVVRGRDAAQHPQCPGRFPAENDLAPMSGVLGGTLIPA